MAPSKILCVITFLVIFNLRILNHKLDEIFMLCWLENNLNTEITKIRDYRNPTDDFVKSNRLV